MSVPALTLPEFLSLTLPRRVAYLKTLEECGALNHRRHLVEAQPHWTPKELEQHLLSITASTKVDLYSLLGSMTL